MYGDINAARVPHLPPIEMRTADKMKREDLLEFLAGVDLSAYLLLDTNYEIFCHQSLMRPLTAGEIPERVWFFFTKILLQNLF